MTTTTQSTATTQPTATDRRVPSPWTSGRAQLASAGLIWTLLVLAPRWDDAPTPVVRVVDSLPAALTDLPLWTAGIGVLVAVVATISLVVARRR